MKTASKWIKFLKKSLEAERWEDRLYAVVALARIDSREASDSFLKLLDDPQAEVRREAAKALGLIGDSRVRSKLEALGANDDDPGVQEQACASLSMLLAR
jgi:HEAT repeat protein